MSSDAPTPQPDAGQRHVDAGADPRPSAPVTPIPIPGGAREVLLVGGLFDPPHRAHVELAEFARRTAGSPSAWLIFVPAAASPLKPGGPAAPDRDRVAMLQRAIDGLEWAAIWTDEIDRAAAAPGPSYWIDTLRRARRALPGATPIRFVIGADQAAEFHRWRSPREILAMAAPVVLLRPPIETPEALVGAMRRAGYWSEQELAEWRSRILANPLTPVSASDARQALQRGDTARAAEALQPQVLDYIRERALYRPVAGTPGSGAGR